ncbi:hypothetical protein ACO0LG_29225 [Undibacterium sp. Ji42W]|uniref:hypothetical protein n=1 Tax=Undibacterium sp. Ji42W TaxID=3413039 RepID=UPI003BF42029
MIVALVKIAGLLCESTYFNYILMVFLVFTREGLDELILLNTTVALVIWCGSNVLTEAEYAGLSAKNISRFIYPLKSPADTNFSSALDTISDHHPGKKIWIENLS